MADSGTRPREIALPLAAFTGLRDALANEAGADAVATALQEAGRAAGDSLFPLLNEAGDSVNLDEAGFWKRLDSLLSTRGWGHLAHEAVHPGIGALDSADWVEADPANGAYRPSCFFTTGLLANLLGHTADHEVAVLEVECRSRGDLRCRFLFGGTETLHHVYDRLRSGQDVTGVIEALR